MGTATLRVYGSDICDARTKAAAVLAIRATYEGLSVVLTERNSSGLRHFLPSPLMDTGELELYNAKGLHSKTFVIALAQAWDKDRDKGFEELSREYDLVIVSEGATPKKGGKANGNGQASLVVGGYDGLLLKDALSLGKKLKGLPFVGVVPDHQPAAYKHNVEQAKKKLGDFAEKTWQLPAFSYSPFDIPGDGEIEDRLWQDAREIIEGVKPDGAASTPGKKPDAKLLATATPTTGNESAVQAQPEPIPGASTAQDILAEGDDPERQVADSVASVKQDYEQSASAAETERLEAKAAADSNEAKDEAGRQEKLRKKEEELAAKTKAAKEERKRKGKEKQDLAQKEAGEVSERLEQELAETEERLSASEAAGQEQEADAPPVADEAGQPQQEATSAEAEVAAVEPAAAPETPDQTMAHVDQVALQEPVASQAEAQQEPTQEEQPPEPVAEVQGEEAVADTVPEEVAVADAVQPEAAQVEAALDVPVDQPVAETGDFPVAEQPGQQSGVAQEPQPEAGQEGEAQADPHQPVEIVDDVVFDLSSVPIEGGAEDEREKQGQATDEAMSVLGAPENGGQKQATSEESLAPAAASEEQPAETEASAEELPAGPDTDPVPEEQPVETAADATVQQEEPAREEGAAEEPKLDAAPAAKPGGDKGYKITRMQSSNRLHLFKLRQLEDILQPESLESILEKASADKKFKLPKYEEGTELRQGFLDLSGYYMRKMPKKVREKGGSYVAAVTALSLAKVAEEKGDATLEEVIRDFANEAFSKMDPSRHSLSHWVLNTLWLAEHKLATGMHADIVDLANNLFELTYQDNLKAATGVQKQVMQAAMALVLTKIDERIQDQDSGGDMDQSYQAIKRIFEGLPEGIADQIVNEGALEPGEPGIGEKAREVKAAFGDMV